MAQALVTPVRSGVGALAHIGEAAIAPLQQFIQKVEGVVLQHVPPAAAYPAFEVDLVGALHASFEDRVEASGQRRVGNRKAELVIASAR
jgi:hypothetical protein